MPGVLLHRDVKPANVFLEVKASDVLPVAGIVMGAM